ncbi:PREDICTED: homeobox protein notochord [Colobus angolensis palliatus]|uniref:homeobox protein notochord n=1 Tax=Colobus angolensis palliatus TaxID=336983 RepID=UPI0005F44D74|nr:PREDICTED: homeobox protein notochord [Colobus angolensis palliatus]
MGFATADLAVEAEDRDSLPRKPPARGLPGKLLRWERVGVRAAQRLNAVGSRQALGLQGDPALLLVSASLDSLTHPRVALGLELAHCSGLWAFPDWAPTEDLRDTERQQKRVRTMFNLEQLEELEKVFAKQHNLVGKKRAQLAARLKLTENQVRVWFQNRRVKYQKQQKLRAAVTSAEAASLDEPSSSSNASIQSDDAESGVDG